MPYRYPKILKLPFPVRVPVPVYVPVSVQHSIPWPQAQQQVSSRPRSRLHCFGLRPCRTQTSRTQSSHLRFSDLA